MKITLKQLQVFVLTSQMGSVSKAADACFITQSAASMALAELERFFGFPLFDRVGKKLMLNSDGAALLPKAKDLIDRAQELSVLTQNAGDLISGTLKISASTTIGNYVLPQYLAQFQQLHPESTFKLVISNTENAIQQLLQFECDIAVIEGDCHHPLIDKKTWRQDELVILSSASHPLAKQPQVHLDDTSHYRWVCRESGSGTGELFFNFISTKFELDIALTLSNPEAIKNYVRSSECLTCVSQAIVNTKVDKTLKVLPVTGFKLKRPFYILLHKQKYKNAAAAAFLSMLEA